MVLTIIFKRGVAQENVAKAVQGVGEVTTSGITAVSEIVNGGVGAVLGTIRTADEIGSEAGSTVRKALLNAAALPHDVIDALLTGKT